MVEPSSNSTFQLDAAATSDSNCADDGGEHETIIELVCSIS